MGPAFRVQKATVINIILCFIIFCPGDTYEVCRLATELPAYQISVWGGNEASYAVDSYRHTNVSVTPHSCSVTGYETNPWWMVDLGIPLTVTGVYFTNVDHPGAQTADTNCKVGYSRSRI